MIKKTNISQFSDDELLSFLETAKVSDYKNKEFNKNIELFFIKKD